MKDYGASNRVLIDTESLQLLLVQRVPLSRIQWLLHCNTELVYDLFINFIRYSSNIAASIANYDNAVSKHIMYHKAGGIDKMYVLDMCLTIALLTGFEVH